MRRVMVGWKVDLADRWLSGEFTDLSQYATAIKNAKAIGQAETLSTLLEMDFEGFATEVKDE